MSGTHADCCAGKVRLCDQGTATSCERKTGTPGITWDTEADAEEGELGEKMELERLKSDGWIQELFQREGTEWIASAKNKSRLECVLQTHHLIKKTEGSLLILPIDRIVYIPFVLDLDSKEEQDSPCFPGAVNLVSGMAVCH